jgi:hypothetical protein
MAGVSVSPPDSIVKLFLLPFTIVLVNSNSPHNSSASLTIVLHHFTNDDQYRARILKHFKVTAEKTALGKVNFSNGILKQPDFSLTAVHRCCQETYSLATGLNATVLVTLLERQLVCLRIPKMQVWLERYIFKRKVIFSTSMKCLRIRAQDFRLNSGYCLVYCTQCTVQYSRASLPPESAGQEHEHFRIII